MFTIGPPMWGAQSDPLFANVIALLHLNDGAAVVAPFVDSSSYAGTQTGVATLATTTADAKFGASSLQRPAGTTTNSGWPTEFGGNLWKTVKTISVAANSPITLEAWVKVPAAVSGGTKLLRVWFRNAGLVNVDYDLNWSGGGGASAWTCNRNDSTLRATSADTPPHSAFRHVALSLTPGGTGYFFVDGTQVGASFAVGTCGVSDEVGITIFNGDGAGAAGAILVDEVRVTLAARYAASFTPPSSEFPNN